MPQSPRLTMENNINSGLNNFYVHIDRTLKRLYFGYAGLNTLLKLLGLVSVYLQGSCAESLNKYTGRLHPISITECCCRDLNWQFVIIIIQTKMMP